MLAANDKAVEASATTATPALARSPRSACQSPIGRSQRQTHVGGSFDAWSHPDRAREQDRAALLAIGRAHPELVPVLLAIDRKAQARRTTATTQGVEA
jgi:hypothetical protein